jgi:hypothetical protein
MCAAVTRLYNNRLGYAVLALLCAHHVYMMLQIVHKAATLHESVSMSETDQAQLRICNMYAVRASILQVL